MFLVLLLGRCFLRLREVAALNDCHVESAALSLPDVAVVQNGRRALEVLIVAALFGIHILFLSLDFLKIADPIIT